MDESRLSAVRAQFVYLCTSYAPPLRKIDRMHASGAEFDALVAAGRFPRIAILDDSLLGSTHMVYMQDPEGSWHRIGQYMLEIRRDGFYAFNQGSLVGGYNGPHIDKSGCICVSSGKEEIMLAIKNGHLAEALQQVERLVWHTNPEHKGQFQGAQVVGWPLATQGEVACLQSAKLSGQKLLPAASSASGQPAATSRGFWRALVRRT